MRRPGEPVFFIGKTLVNNYGLKIELISILVGKLSLGVRK
jgi:hypothetical protein